MGEVVDDDVVDEEEMEKMRKEFEFFLEQAVGAEGLDMDYIQNHLGMTDEDANDAVALLQGRASPRGSMSYRQDKDGKWGIYLQTGDLPSDVEQWPDPVELEQGDGYAIEELLVDQLNDPVVKLLDVEQAGAPIPDIESGLDSKTPLPDKVEVPREMYPNIDLRLMDLADLVNPKEVGMVEEEESMLAGDDTFNEFSEMVARGDDSWSSILGLENYSDAEMLAKLEEKFGLDDEMNARRMDAIRRMAAGGLSDHAHADDPLVKSRAVPFQHPHPDVVVAKDLESRLLYNHAMSSGDGRGPNGEKVLITEVIGINPGIMNESNIYDENAEGYYGSFRNAGDDGTGLFEDDDDEEEEEVEEDVDVDAQIQKLCDIYREELKAGPLKPSELDEQAAEEIDRLAELFKVDKNECMEQFKEARLAMSNSDEDIEEVVNQFKASLLNIIGSDPVVTLPRKKGMARSAGDDNSLESLSDLLIPSFSDDDDDDDDEKEEGEEDEEDEEDIEDDYDEKEDEEEDYDGDEAEDDEDDDDEEEDEEEDGNESKMSFHEFVSEPPESHYLDNRSKAGLFEDEDNLEKDDQWVGEFPDGLEEMTDEDAYHGEHDHDDEFLKSAADIEFNDEEATFTHEAGLFPENFLKSTVGFWHSRTKDWARQLTLVRESRSSAFWHRLKSKSRRPEVRERRLAARERARVLREEHDPVFLGPLRRKLDEHNSPKLSPARRRELQAHLDMYTIGVGHNPSWTLEQQHRFMNNLVAFFNDGVDDPEHPVNLALRQQQLCMPFSEQRRLTTVEVRHLLGDLVETIDQQNM